MWREAGTACEWHTLGKRSSLVLVRVRCAEYLLEVHKFNDVYTRGLEDGQNFLASLCQVVFEIFPKKKNEEEDLEDHVGTTLFRGCPRTTMPLVEQYRAKEKWIVSPLIEALFPFLLTAAS